MPQLYHKPFSALPEEASGSAFLFPRVFYWKGLAFF